MSSPACNGMKLLNADGNYDYYIIDKSKKKKTLGGILYMIL